MLTGVRTPRARIPLPGAEVLPQDVADPASIVAAVAAVKARHGRLDVLVNNAGILLDRIGDVMALEAELLHRTLETNTRGPLRMCQGFGPLMPGGSRIINVSSVGGQLSAPSTWAPAYGISKTALNALTIQLAEALKPRGIAVNSVCPGWVRTDMGRPEAPRTLEQGAESLLWLVSKAKVTLTRGFWRDGQRIEW